MNPVIKINDFVKYSFCLAVLVFIFVAEYSMYHVFSILPICLIPGVVFLVQRNYPYLSVKQCFSLSIAWGSIFLFSLFSEEIPAPVNIILFICCIVFLSRSMDERRSIAELFVRVYVVVLSISLLEYLLYLNGYYHSLGIVVREGVVKYDYIQLLFNIIRVPDLNSFTRFQSLANEPGFVGTLNALLLFNINNKNYKKEYWILVLTGVFTLSLAFYILFFVYIISIIKSKKNILIVILTISILSFLVIMNSDRPEIQYVKYRFELGEDADNRTTEQFKLVYEQFQESNDRWLGNGLESLQKINIVDGGNDGIYRLTYEIGYIGIILLIISYSYIIWKSKGKKMKTLFFLVAFWASFYQRAGLLQPQYIIVAAMPFLDFKSTSSKKS